MVEVDAALLLGLTGTILGAGSLLYARTQARAARGQAEAQHRAALIDVNRSVMDETRRIRNDIITNPAFREAYLRANPQLAATFAAAGGMEAIIAMRNALDACHDTWYLRKLGIIEDHYWRNWGAAFVPLLRTPEVQLIFENAVARKIYDDDFVEGVRAAIRDSSFPDPRARP